MNAISRMVGGPLDRSEAVDHGHPDDFYVRAFHVDERQPRIRYGIFDKNHVRVDRSTDYPTFDAAEEAIGKMIDEYELEQKERLRREDEAPYRGPRFGSAGANSAGRS